jgi:hypothetical protein
MTMRNAGPNAGPRLSDARLVDVWHNPGLSVWGYEGAAAAE